MTVDPVDDMIRRAIGGDVEAVAWIAAIARGPDVACADVACADVACADVAVVIVMAALLECDPSRLDRARAAAITSRDRQTVEIARAFLDGSRDLVDALARDHLADHPDSLIVAWIASKAADRDRPDERR